MRVAVVIVVVVVAVIVVMVVSVVMAVVMALLLCLLLCLLLLSSSLHRAHTLLLEMLDELGDGHASPLSISSNASLELCNLLGSWLLARPRHLHGHPLGRSGHCGFVVDEMRRERMTINRRLQPECKGEMLQVRSRGREMKVVDGYKVSRVKVGAMPLVLICEAPVDNRVFTS